MLHHSEIKMPDRGYGAVATLWLAIACAFVWLTLRLGRDTPWDYFAYHGYAAWTVFQNRFEQDWFGAGLQGYLNPLGFVPFGLMQRLGFNSVATGIGLALVHSLNGLVMALLCRDIAARQDRWDVFLPAVALSCMSPVLLAHLGSTFTDPIGSISVLLAVWLISRETERAYFWAGMASGLAIAIKLSNAVFVVAIVLASALFWRDGGRHWLRRMVAQAVGGVLGLLLFQGYWSWQLYKHMASPLFPFFNQIFKSPYYPIEGAPVGRFNARSFEELLYSPIELAKYSSWTTMEIPAPSLIPLVTFVVMIVFLMRRLWLHSRRESVNSCGHMYRLCAFVVVSYVLWAKSSGNARYAIPMFMVMGALAVFMVRDMLPKRYGVLLAWMLVVLQFGMTWDAGIIRWRSQQWTQAWMPVDLPKSIASKPALFLTIARQSHTHLVMDVHPDSAFVVLLNGQMSVPSTGAGSERLHELMKKYSGNIKVIAQAPSLLDIEISLPSLVRRMNGTLDRVGLEALEKTCQKVVVNGSPGLDMTINEQLDKPVPEVLYVCDARKIEPKLTQERELAERIMDAYEKRCRDVLSPQRPQIENIGDLWVRMYSKYDSAFMLVSFKENFISYGFTWQQKPTVIGSPSTWQKDIEKAKCDLPYGGKRGFKAFEAELMEYGDGDGHRD